MMRRAPAVVAMALVGAGAAVSSCAPKHLSLPTGSSTPFAGYAAAYAQAVEPCRDVNALTVTIGVSGRAGKEKLRGRIQAGFAVPERIRLEGLHPLFGKPVFILAARDRDATLLLTREERVLRNAPAASIVEALAGIAVTPAEMRSAIAGCGLGVVSPAAGREYGTGWAAVDAAPSTVYLRNANGRWHVAAVVKDAITLQYPDAPAERPPTIRFISGGADVTLHISDLEINPSLGPEAFEVEVPRDATPISLDELRKAGPLGGSGKS
jgi:hypothetical protein